MAKEIKNEVEDWQTRLLAERKELLDKTLKLKSVFADPEKKLSEIEWDMLRHQYGAMRDYLQALTDRCVYYELIDSGNLDLNYSGPLRNRY